MMFRRSLFWITGLCILFGAGAIAQTNGVIIDYTGATRDPSAVLEVKSTTQGMLVLRVALTGTSSGSPITSPAISLLVYNTVTASDVTLGYYYWDGSAWQWCFMGGTNNVTGSGTTNVLPKWTSASGLGDSRIFDNGTNIGIGTTSPAASVEIRGNTVKVGSNSDDSHSWFPFSDGNV